DYTKPSHEDYKNTIKLLKMNNVVPLRSDTIRLVQKEFSFHRLRFEDPNQHLKDFLKRVDSLDFNGDNMERTGGKNRVNNRAIVKSIVEPSKYEEEEPPKKASVTNEVERRADDEPTKSVRENVMKNKEEQPTGVSSSYTVGYYLKHKINEKLIEGLMEN
nr:zinc finger, CCHC-type [Tanacetum cinerariifolium]